MSSHSPFFKVHASSTHLSDLPLYTPVLLVESPNLLGEGPVWDAHQNHLYWVDIKQSTLWRWSWADNQVQSWKLDVRASALTMCDQGGLVLAAEQSIYHFDPATNTLNKLLTLPQEPSHNRTNDGKCDPFGHFWVGTMDDEERWIKMIDG